MADGSPEKPSPPDLPTYVREPLEAQSPEGLDTVAEYASALADWKRDQREREFERRRAKTGIDESERADLADRGISTDPDDYEGAPDSGAYITVKTTKRSGDTAYRYYYWQWREGDTWENEYIAPVEPQGE